MFEPLWKEPVFQGFLCGQQISVTTRPLKSACHRLWLEIDFQKLCGISGQQFWDYLSAPHCHHHHQHHPRHGLFTTMKPKAAQMWFINTTWTTQKQACSTKNTLFHLPRFPWFKGQGGNTCPVQVKERLIAWKKKRSLAWEASDTAVRRVP